MTTPTIVTDARLVELAIAADVASRRHFYKSLSDYSASEVRAAWAEVQDAREAVAIALRQAGPGVMAFGSVRAYWMGAGGMLEMMIPNSDTTSVVDRQAAS